ncbi:MAG TPA: hypothetical protein GX697_03480 [Firmicutes bacterium]|nr:hypothetical protein [Bacillota bacterium]
MSELIQEQSSTFEQADIDNNKTIAGLAYLLFFLPLLVCPQSKYGRFHANQALILFIVAIAGNIVLGMIPLFGWMLMPFYGLLILALVIIGLINGLNGRPKRLPVIGNFDLLK